MTRWFERGVPASATFAVADLAAQLRDGEMAIDVEGRAATTGNGTGAHH